MPSRLPKHLEQLRFLAICHFAYSVFALLGLVVLCLQYSFTQQIISRHDEALSGPGGDALQVDTAISGIFSGFFLFFGVLLVGMFAANVVTGICLYQLKCRTLSLIVAVLNCLQFPVGTVLGVLTILALFQDPVREAYDGDAGLGFTKQ